ncbi:MAG: hypothetical protein COY81_03070 [Candidatus Pacebacteria bacterium CG_4_10_14_0_8_um_filter_43_12]|nr:MAG: hypothetical protein COY81_03070 [Candidatus Pacebacteria bacterium CG_4_10_14_0_8_um_filter_43_12]
MKLVQIKRIEADSVFDGLLTAVVVSSLIAIGMALIYLVSRTGLPIDYLSILKALSVSLFVLNTPAWVIVHYGLKRMMSSVQAEYAIVLLGILLSLALIGWLLPTATILLIPIFFVGGVTCWINCTQWWGQHQTSYLMICFSTLFGLWIGASVWSQGNLTPFIWEKILDQTVHSETLFHTSITNMLRYYQVPSTGLDGLPKLQYHYGSHLLFAAVSKLLNTSSLNFYQLGYPVIFFPLLSVSLINAVTQLRQVFCRRKVTKSVGFGKLFWIISVVWLIGVLPTPLLYKLGMPPLLFFSESYCVVMSFSLLLFSIIAARLQSKISIKQPSSIVSLFVLLFFILCIGLIKISHLYFFVLTSWYYVIRTRQKSAWLLATLVVLSIGSWFVYREVLLLDHAGGFWLFFYFTQIITLKWLPVWLIIGLGSTWAYLIFVLLRNKHYTQNSWLDLELVGWVTFIGILPPVLFNLGPNANYFVDATRWLSFILILSQTQTLESLIKNRLVVTGSWFAYTAVRIGTLLVLAIFGGSFLFNFSAPFEKMYKDRNQALIVTAETNRQAILQKLKYLGETTHLPKTALYMAESSSFWHDQAPCSDSGLLVTGLSGYSLLEGMPNQKCNYRKYAYSLYEQRPKTLSINNLSELCQYAQNRGFAKVIVFTIIDQTIECQ